MGPGSSAGAARARSAGAGLRAAAPTGPLDVDDRPLQRPAQRGEQRVDGLDVALGRAARSTVPNSSRRKSRSASRCRRTLSAWPVAKAASGAGRGRCGPGAASALRTRATGAGSGDRPLSDGGHGGRRAVARAGSPGGARSAVARAAYAAAVGCGSARPRPRCHWRRRCQRRSNVSTARSARRRGADRAPGRSSCRACRTTVAGVDVAAVGGLVGQALRGALQDHRHGAHEPAGAAGRGAAAARSGVAPLIRVGRVARDQRRGARDEPRGQRDQGADERLGLRLALRLARPRTARCAIGSASR